MQWCIHRLDVPCITSVSPRYHTGSWPTQWKTGALCTLLCWCAKLRVLCCVVLCCVVWPVPFPPVDPMPATKQSFQYTQLFASRLTFSNEYDWESIGYQFLHRFKFCRSQSTTPLDSLGHDVCRNLAVTRKLCQHLPASMLYSPICSSKFVKTATDWRTKRFCTS